MRFVAFALSVFLTWGAFCPDQANAQGSARAELDFGWEQFDWQIGAPSIFPGKEALDGISYAANIGYDVPVLPRVSVGVDASLGGTSAGLDPDTILRSFRAGRDLYVGARVTVHVAPRLHVYAKAGYANARIETNLGLIARAEWGGKYGRDIDKLRNLDGIRGGIGIQYSLTGPFYTLAEYRYTNHPDQISRNQIVTGIGIKF